MRHFYDVLRFFLLACVLFTGACGPNVLSTRGTVLNPLFAARAAKDPEAPRPPSILVIRRRENRVVIKHHIIGPQGRPMGLEILGEYAALIGERSGHNRMYFDAIIFSNYKDELVRMESYDYFLVLPDGRRIKGSVHFSGQLQNHTVKITGARLEPHLIVFNGESATILSHVQEVENEIPMFARAVRVEFLATDLLTEETDGVTFIISGYYRERRYRFDFTSSPYKAMAWWIAHMQ